MKNDGFPETRSQMSGMNLQIYCLKILRLHFAVVSLSLSFFTDVYSKNLFWSYCLLESQAHLETSSIPSSCLDYSRSSILPPLILCHLTYGIYGARSSQSLREWFLLWSWSQREWTVWHFLVTEKFCYYPNQKELLAPCDSL